MLRSSFFRRVCSGVLAFVAIAGVSACDDSTSPAGLETLQKLRIIAGASSVDVWDDGWLTGDSLRATGDESTVSTYALQSSGVEVPSVKSGNYRVDITGGSGFTLTRVDPFTFRIKGTTTAASVVSVALFDVSANRAVYGPFNVPVAVTIAPPDQQ